MTPEQINTIIPEIHDERKERGEWGGFYCDSPYEDCLYQCAFCNKFDDVEEKQKSFLAERLDLITEAIVDAMRARREDNRADESHIFYLSGEDDPLFSTVIGATYEQHLALAAIRTMDLMGFQGETHIEHTPIIMIHSNSVDYLRSAAATAANVAEMTAEDSGIRNGALSGIINRIVAIAELDSIDIAWHINARREYERSQQCHK